MAEFKVLKPYKDVELDRVLKEGEEVEMTVKRSKEIADKLGDDFLKRLDKPPSKQEGE